MIDTLGLSRSELLHALDSTEQGLSEEEASARLQRVGLNQIRFHRTRSPLRMLLKEFTALFPLLLMAAAILALFADYVSPGEGYRLIGAALLAVVLQRGGTKLALDAKELDDNFATYVLASNIPEILPFLAWVLLPIPLPITVVGILTNRPSGDKA